MSDKRPHLKLYSDFIKGTLDLSPSAFRTLLGLTVYVDSDNVVDLSRHKRATLLQMLGTCKQTLSNNLVELQHAALIKKLGSGLFVVDSMYIENQTSNAD